MSDTKYLEQLMPEINSILDADIKKPSIPYEIYIYEAERLHTRATEDLPALLAINMPKELLDELYARTMAFRRAQLDWTEKSNEKKEVRAAWKKALPEFKKLRLDLIRTFQFAFRKDKNLSEFIAKIKKDQSHADISMNLYQLAKLGEHNSQLLEAINFDFSILEHTKKEHKRMSNLLSEVHSLMHVDNSKLSVRNKAFSLLKECVDEVRCYGRFAFANQSNLAKAYSSEYRREKQREYQKSKKQNNAN
ncbi:hypothetical protein [Marinifilum sp.]|uniref:hypothetical protein n=1 Tax=Marinifilum sp. TaxID=2033137 RepID=UPI003BA8BD95